MREVTLGSELGDSYAIESGLKPGEEIAVNGTFSIDAAAQLAGKPSMMNPQGNGMSGHNYMVNKAAKKDDVSISDETKTALEPLFDSYFDMTEALFNDDFEEALEFGELMSASLGTIDEGLFEGQALNIWQKQSTVLKADLKDFEQLDNIDHLRSNYLSVSNAMIILAEAFDPITSVIYIQHCPMADSNEGADWLSREKEILNPYFGAAMLSCGETKRTL